MTTSTVQGSSFSSSSSVTRTFTTTSSTTFHSQSSSSNHFHDLHTNDGHNVLEAVRRIDKLSINRPEAKSISRKDDKLPIKFDKVSVPLKNVEPVVVVAAPNSTAQNIDKFRLDCLNAHNDYRRKHGVEPLKLNSTLSNFAQNWANVGSDRSFSLHSSV